MANNNSERDMNNEEFSTGNAPIEDSSVNFIQKNSKIIIIVSIALIVAVAAFAYIKFKNNENSITASTLMSRILPYYDKADYQKALDGDPSKTYLGEPVKGLKYIASEFSGTEQGKLASFYVANILLSTGKYADATKYFDEAASSESREVQSGVMAGKAACLETEKKYDEAAKLYEDASKLVGDDNLKARFTFYAAYAYEKASKKELSEKLYREIVLSAKLSEFSEMAKEGLIRLGTIIE
ncbi:MAG TPA: tetratricopeptide repeat protein [Candidatus Kapabacteria bacterium]|nr:tetratricopeptide repeat protein [Candidatus Kapabacteria bacterium]